ncbi:hypothetical protein GA0111570_10246 [Raineyella antarctica]|uniref:Uncharacterized protein n=1 Tax=Raineyella antarctica TaxID=1577474 RepID=A0A1G6GE62_9ACTN|nr:hypothetical protein GA0111570_10246 [Raineyella antarctica]
MVPTYTVRVATFYSALLIGICVLVGVLALYLVVRLIMDQQGRN